MATFRSILFRGIFVAAVLSVSFISLGATFAPLNFPFQGSLEPLRLGPPRGLKIVSSPVESKFPFRRDVALSRLEELVLTHRAIATSA